MAISNASNQIVKVNLIPGVIPSVLHLSQYDTGAGRPITFSVYDGSQKFTIPSDVFVTFEGTKPDGNGFSFRCSKSGNNAFLTDYTNQMTACAGKIMCQLVFKDASNARVGSLSILMIVNPAGIDADTELSPSDIGYIVKQAELDKKINTPIINPNGTSGQLLRTLGNGETEWVDQGLPTDEQTAQAVSDWLDEHPEATTTVQDGSLTESKFSNTLKLKAIKDYVTPEMYGAHGDGTHDDSVAFQAAIDTGRLVIASSAKTVYLIANTLSITSNVILIVDSKITCTANELLLVTGRYNHIELRKTVTCSGNGILFSDAGQTNSVSTNELSVKNISIDGNFALKLYSENKGVSHNKFSVEQVFGTNCQISVYLYAETDGYINENTFYKGAYCGKTAAIVMENRTTSHDMNNNAFYDIDPETAAAGIRMIALSPVKNNYFYNLRLQEYNNKPAFYFSGRVTFNVFQSNNVRPNMINAESDFECGISSVNIIRGALLTNTGAILWKGNIAILSSSSSSHFSLYPITMRDNATESITGDIQFDISAATMQNHHRFNRFQTASSSVATSPIITLDDSFGFKKIDSLWINMITGRVTPTVQLSDGTVIFSESGKAEYDFEIEILFDAESSVRVIKTQVNPTASDLRRITYNTKSVTTDSDGRAPIGLKDTNGFLLSVNAKFSSNDPKYIVAPYHLNSYYWVQCRNFSDNSLAASVTLTIEYAYIELTT